MFLIKELDELLEVNRSQPPPVTRSGVFEASTQFSGLKSKMRSNSNSGFNNTRDQRGKLQKFTTPNSNLSHNINDVSPVPLVGKSFVMKQSSQAACAVA